MRHIAQDRRLACAMAAASGDLQKSAPAVAVLLTVPFDNRAIKRGIVHLPTNVPFDGIPTRESSARPRPAANYKNARNACGSGAF